jgi:sphingolipid delta-4 desaturase
MARTASATANGHSQAKEPAVNGNSCSDGAAADPDDAKYRDFFWTYTEEPHRTRRLAIIKAHPEVSRAYCCDHPWPN